MAAEADNEPIWRLKKSADDSVYGPVNKETLREWANSAQVSPTDEIDSGDDNWRVAWKIDFLQMLWTVRLPENEVYGPTTVGTLREFHAQGLINDRTPVTSVQNDQILPLNALFASHDLELRRARIQTQEEPHKQTLEVALDLAKDQRIRQLQEDLRQLRVEHEALLQKYRQVTASTQTDMSATRSLQLARSTSPRR